MALTQEQVDGLRVVIECMDVERDVIERRRAGEQKSSRGKRPPSYYISECVS
jgi:hypothetical protein